MSSPTLFPEDEKPAPRTRKTKAPDQLSDRDRLRVHEWAELRFPWVSRGALGCPTTLEGYEDECLVWFGGKGKMHADWARTVMNWIRSSEKKRLMPYGRAPEKPIQEAMRDPAAWARMFDYGARIEKQAKAEPQEIIRPMGGTIANLGR